MSTEAMVTISLKEVENLKSTIENQKRQIDQLNAQKNYTVTWRVNINEWYNRLNSVTAVAVQTVTDDMELLKVNGRKELQEAGKKAWDELMKHSPVMRFYKKFPRWVHKLLKCN